MDILYIIGKGFSNCDNLELRFSLRSIEKYGKNVGRVFVVGYCPEWLSDEVIKIPFEQPYEKKEDDYDIVRKHANLTASLLYAVDHSDIGDEFLVSMDDHFYIRNTDFDHYPFYCKASSIPQSIKTLYNKFLCYTRHQCEMEKISKYYCCPHRNMHMSRKTISDRREFLDDAVELLYPLEPFAYLLNYRYTHDKDFEFEVIKDIKIKNGSDWYKADPRNTECISTYDFSEGIGLETLLKGLYNKKSKYEI